MGFLRPIRRHRLAGVDDRCMLLLVVDSAGAAAAGEVVSLGP